MAAVQQGTTPRPFGTLLERTAISTSVPGAIAWRVRYTSVDLRGLEHEVSGLVVAPSTPGEHRPMLTWCHGTTGLGDAGCPSALPDPVRELTIYFSPEATEEIDYGVPGLERWIAAGYVVCATDYQGLGSPGIHQYAVSRTNALDALGLAVAARQMDIGTGQQVAAVGWSQGGGAAAALSELPDESFGDLQLIGSACLSPGVVSASFTASTGADVASLSDATVAPSGHLLMTVYGHAAACPELDLDSVLTPLGRSLLDGVWNTQAVHHLSDTTARIFRLQGPLMHANPLADPAWATAFRSGSAGQAPPRCPILVCMDTFDGGTTVPVAWQEAYVADARAHGGDVTVLEYPSADHFSLCAEAIGDVFSWVESQFQQG